MTFLVHEMRRDDAVGAPDDVTEERRRVRVRRVGRQDAAVECIAEQRPVGREPPAGAPPVVLEAVGEHLQPVPPDAFRHGSSVFVADLQTAGVVEGKRGVVDHGCDDGGFERHGQREVAGEAQPHGADAGSAPLGVRDAGEASQP